MRVGLLIGLAIILAIIAFILILKVVKGLALKIVVVCVAVVLFFGGVKVINLNTLSSDVEAKVQTVVDTVGDSSIKTDGSKVLVKIDNGWYDVSKLSVVGGLLTDDVKLRYEGKEIYVGHSGVVNTLKTLEKVGLLGEEK